MLCYVSKEFSYYISVTIIGKVILKKSLERGYNMLKVENLSYSFPQKDLYNKVSFELLEGHHCAFIGPSGIGKSTLIDIIMNPDNYMFDGSLEIEPTCKIGYVSQFSQIDKANKVTVIEYIGEDFIKLQNEINEICTEMETSSDIEPLLEEYQKALDAYDSIGGDDFESLINKKLNLANLSKYKERSIAELSGGEFKLIQVIKEMLHKPDLMIMDEPDVFLDFENLNSLKDLINSHKGTLLIITHNRYLLNNCFNKILHLENMEIQEFNGRYIDYNFALLQTKIELQELATIDSEEIERNRILLEKLRFNANLNAEAAKGKSVNARAKIIERLEARRIKAPFVAIKEPNIHFDVDEEFEESLALRVNNYSLAFDEVILENVSFEVNSTDKVALIGSNGTGKTTLLKAIYENKSDAIELSDQVKLGYLSQIQGETLNESNTIADEFFDAGFKSYDDIKSHIENYGMDPEIIHQRIESLSGGEKNMLQLAKISSFKANMLLLDEPTSHLDTYTQVALEKAIEDYKGSILMISHDYYTIANCMDYVLIIEDKKVRKMSMRKFRKMVYASHFDKDYLEIEEKKKSLEREIELALKDNNFEGAKKLAEELEILIKSL